MYPLQSNDRSGFKTFSFHFFARFRFFPVFIFLFLFERIFTFPFPLTYSLFFSLTNIFISVSVNENHTVWCSVQSICFLILHVLDVGTVGFADESAMVQEFMRTFDAAGNTKKVLAGVVFIQMPPNHSRTSLSSIEYKLRFPSTLRSASGKINLNPYKNINFWMTQYMFPILQRVGPRGNSTQGGPPGC